MPATKIMFGAWDHLLFDSWGTLAIEVNLVTNFPAGLIGLRILHEVVDVAALDPTAFSICTGVT
jgi:hypothetical protein